MSKLAVSALLAILGGGLVVGGVAVVSAPLAAVIAGVLVLALAVLMATR
jgi:hypothetical protein